MKKRNKCKHNYFFAIAEKIYEGSVDENNVLRCEPANEEIIEIKCVECGQFYKESDFSDIDY